MKQAELRIDASWIAPVEPAHTVLHGYSIIIDNGNITAVVEQSTADREFAATETVSLDGHLLIPGLINAHTHASMSLLRGIADDLPLMEWLNDHIWPVEQRLMSPDFVRDGSMLAIAEMLKAGVTCFNDMYFFPDATAQAARETGIRAVLGLIVIDFPSAWAAGPEEYLQKAEQLHAQLVGEPLLHTALAPHAPYSVSDGPLSDVADLSTQLNIPVHIHVHETRDEIDSSLKQYGERPFKRMQKLGLVNEKLIAVHCCHLEADEIRAISESGTKVAHCPESNLKLANGFCPVNHLLAAGATVALGTDGAASNNNLDLLEEMRLAALLAKGTGRNASALPAHEALKMATLSGAQALGIDHVTGSIVPGKSADIVALDFNRIDCQPLYDPVAQLVYAARSDAVSDVWVAGRRLLKSGKLTTIHEPSLLQNAHEWGEKIQASHQA